MQGKSFNIIDKYPIVQNEKLYIVQGTYKCINSKVDNLKKKFKTKKIYLYKFTSSLTIKYLQ